jgi:hypothetical protein
MPTSLPKDHKFMERPYSGKAIMYSALRKGPLEVKDFNKAVKAGGREVTAIKRVIYWVSLEVAEYGYDIEVTYDEKTNEPKTLKLVKSADGPKPKKSSKKAPKKSKSSATKKTHSKSKKAASKKSKKESESESSEPESEAETSEEETDESAEE